MIKFHFLKHRIACRKAVRIIIKCKCLPKLKQTNVNVDRLLDRLLKNNLFKQKYKDINTCILTKLYSGHKYSMINIHYKSINLTSCQ